MTRVLNDFILTNHPLTAESFCICRNVLTTLPVWQPWFHPLLAWRRAISISASHRSSCSNIKASCSVSSRTNKKRILTQVSPMDSLMPNKGVILLTWWDCLLSLSATFHKILRAHTLWGWLTPALNLAETSQQITKSVGRRLHLISLESKTKNITSARSEQGGFFPKTFLLTTLLT